MSVEGQAYDKRPLKAKVSISLDQDIIYEIKNYAVNGRTSFSEYINKVLWEHIQARHEEEKKNQ